MYSLLREHRYRLLIGSETHILRVEELVFDSAGWGGKFRLQIPARLGLEAITLYGSSADEVAESGARFLEKEARSRFSS